MYKIGGAHLHYVNNHYAKFEYKGMKTVELQIKHRLQNVSIPEVV